MWGIQVLIPQKLRKKLLCELHTDHPGATRMKSIARSYVWWPGLDKILSVWQDRVCCACLPRELHLLLHFNPGVGHLSHSNEFTWTLQVHFKALHSSLL